MRFLVDMNLSPGWVAFLQDAGFKATHWSTVGPADASDRTLMEWAATHDHNVLTNNIDFSAILTANESRKLSVVKICADLLTPATIGIALLHALAQTQCELERGTLISIDAVQARVRTVFFHKIGSPLRSELRLVEV